MASAEKEGIRRTLREKNTFRVAQESSSGKGGGVRFISGQKVAKAFWWGRMKPTLLVRRAKGFRKKKRGKTEVQRWCPGLKSIGLDGNGENGNVGKGKSSRRFRRDVSENRKPPNNKVTKQ